MSETGHAYTGGRHPALAGPGGMIFSAVLFGYFGFMMGLTTNNMQGQFVWLFAVFLWTIRGASVGYAVAALMTFAMPLAGNLIYAVVGLFSALGFLVLSGWDLFDTQRMLHGMPMLPGWLMLLLFAAWNGYGSWIGLRAVMAVRRMATSRNPYEA